MNRKTLSIAALSMLLPLASHAAVSAISVTGFNQDIVINGAGPYNVSVTSTMDGGLNTPENNTWVEAGNYLNPSGVSTFFPGLTAGTNTSLTGNGTFTFQNFTGNNAFLLTAAVPAGTLTLTTPISYSKLALYGSTAGGPTSASVKLTFSDSSTSTYTITNGTGIGTDWFNNGADKAVVVGGRASNKSEEGYTRLFTGTNSAISINESLLTLSPADQAKVLSSVTVTNTGGGKIAVFALSGEAVPEASTSAIVGLVGMLGLVRRRRA